MLSEAVLLKHGSGAVKLTEIETLRLADELEDGRARQGR